MYAIETILLGSLAAALPRAELQELYQTEDWDALVSIWRILNGVKPVTDYYNFPVATEKGDSITAELDRLFQGMDFESSGIQVALEMTVDLAKNRTMRLSRMNPIMLTRMMPPWTETVQDGLLFSFEERITALSELVDEGEITASEYAAARDSLLEKALSMSLLEMFNDQRMVYYYDYPVLDERTVNADSILKRLDMSYSAALDTLAKAEPSEYSEHYESVVEQHERFMESYDRFREAVPVFRAVLTELMEAGP